MLITLEGIDAAGKGTQSKLLHQALPDSVLFSFPDYSTDIGQRIQSCLRSGQGSRIHPLIWAGLYAQNRRETLPKVQKALDRGQVVICDRWVESNFAFQCQPMVNNHLQFYHEISQLEYGINQMPQPDLVFFLELDLDTALERARARNRPREEFDTRAHLKRVDSCYRMLADSRWVTIDAAQSREEVHEQILGRSQSEISIQGPLPPTGGNWWTNLIRRWGW